MKNEYQEALDKLELNLKRYTLYELSEQDYENLAIIQELVDKATSKEVIKFTSEITNSEEAYTFYTCPICRMLLSNDNYCPNCGQKLEWSDNDED